MYLLLVILGVLLVVAGIASLVRRPHTTLNILLGCILIVLGIIALPSGLSLR